MAPAEEAKTRGGKLLPVTVLSGFLGAGKTTLLKRILTSASAERANFKIAVLVNDMGEINIDADEIKDAKLIQEEAQMVELHNGCICCTLRGDLLKTVKDLSEEKSFDYLVIESTGISEPLPVAQTFVMDITDGATIQPKGGPSTEVNALSAYAKLDTMVTVVDALNVFDVLGSIQTLAEKNVAGMLGNTGIKEEKVKKKKKKAKEEEEEAVDDRNIAQLMIDQIEFANVIIVSKAHLVKEAGALSEVTALLQKLNAGAQLVVPSESHFADLPLSSVINTNLFDMEKAEQSVGWIQELQKPAHTPETEEYGISSVKFLCDSRPFHPARLQNILAGFGNYASSIAASASGNARKDSKDAKIVGAASRAPNGPFEGVVRAKGKLWIASAAAYRIHLQIAGRHLGLQPTQPFLHAIMAQDWPGEDWESLENFDEFKAQGNWSKESGYGDSMSMAVFIGVNLDKERITKELENALLTDEELAGGKSEWKKLDDVFFSGRFFDILPEEPAVRMVKHFVRGKKKA